MKPSWDNAPIWARFVSMDDNGKWFWYERRPEWEPGTGRWLCVAGEFEECQFHADDAGNGSLEPRP